MINQIPIALIVNSGDFVLSFFDIEKENNPMYGYIKWGIVISLSIIYLFIYIRRNIIHGFKVTYSLSNFVKFYDKMIGMK